MRFCRLWRLEEQVYDVRWLHSASCCQSSILGFLLTPAGRSDTQPVGELVDSVSHHLTRLLGDGASHDAAFQHSLDQSCSLHLLAPVNVTRPSQRSTQAHRQLNRLRFLCETVHAQRHGRLHVSRHSAKSTWDLLTRMAATMTAHRVGMMINTLCGRLVLQFAPLAVLTTRTKRLWFEHRRRAARILPVRYRTRTHARGKPTRLFVCEAGPESRAGEISAFPSALANTSPSAQNLL